MNKTSPWVAVALSAPCVAWFVLASPLVGAFPQQVGLWAGLATMALAAAAWASAWRSRTGEGKLPTP